MKVLSYSEARRYFEQGGQVVRTTASMPKMFLLPEGNITRVTINALYREGVIDAHSVNGSSISGAIYRKAE